MKTKTDFINEIKKINYVIELGRKQKAGLENHYRASKNPVMTNAFLFTMQFLGLIRWHEYYFEDMDYVEQSIEMYQKFRSGGFSKDQSIELAVRWLALRKHIYDISLINEAVSRTIVCGSATRKDILANL